MSGAAKAQGKGRLGHLPELWALLILAGVSTATYLACQDFLHLLRSWQMGQSGAPVLWVWCLYIAFQLASKVPIGYRYAPRGFWMLSDLLGFGGGIAAAALFALQIPAVSWTAQSLLAIVSLWMAFATVFICMAPSRQSALARIFCAIVANLLPSAPMLGAAYALATRHTP